jgi:hypothetical protein
MNEDGRGCGEDCVVDANDCVAGRPTSLRRRMGQRCRNGLVETRGG